MGHAQEIMFPIVNPIGIIIVANPDDTNIFWLKFLKISPTHVL